MAAAIHTPARAQVAASTSPEAAPCISPPWLCSGPECEATTAFTSYRRVTGTSDQWECWGTIISPKCGVILEGIKSADENTKCDGCAAMWGVSGCGLTTGPSVSGDKWKEALEAREPCDVSRDADCDGLLNEQDARPFCIDYNPTREGCSLGAFADGTPTREVMIDAIVTAFHVRGVGIGPEHVIAGPKHGDPDSDLWTYMIRLDPDDSPLPSGTTVIEAGEDGEILPGSQPGAPSHLLGSIQLWESGGRIRAATRRVVTETGVVEETGGGDAEGFDPCAVAEAMARALEASGIQFGEARGLEY